MNIKITKLHKNAILPEYQTTGAAGADLHARIDQPIILKPMQRQHIPTGLAIAMPQGVELQIRARSGLSFKYGISMVNGIGTIDSDYRGEIGVLLINLGQEDFTVEPNMRIAQAVISRYETAVWQEVDELDETERGGGGFGSTGVTDSL